MKTWLTVASLALAVAAAFFVLSWPLYSSGDGPPTKTLLDVNGTRALAPVLFPVVVAMVALVFRHRAVRTIAAILMGAFSILGGMSIGLLYLPAALLMVLACCVSDSRVAAD